MHIVYRYVISLFFKVNINEIKLAANVNMIMFKRFSNSKGMNIGPFKFYDKCWSLSSVNSVFHTIYCSYDRNIERNKSVECTIYSCLVS